MKPKLSGIDHVHLQVRDRAAAEQWYAEMLGFSRVEELLEWATPTGPLTLQDESGSVHLALFESDNPVSTSTVAFRADGDAFLAWKAHLERHELALRLTDHQLSYSMYFSDPDQNMHEITTYERDRVAARLADNTAAH